ncbi:GNAT family acetyltransferase [Apiospora hydei]|uniref:GNAT family acetyltransferase n=1 Tax=Apiospora hydei TaxID=1337664 RepID=A0ABR1X9I6_9PEZI
MRTAVREDASRIAEIHMAAFGRNAMLHAQFPTLAIRKGLQKCIKDKAVADINDPRMTVLVVTSSDGPESTAGAVVAFAKWSHPVLPGEDYVEPPWIWPEGTDLETLGAWIAKASEVESRSAVGGVPCYHLSFIGTDPNFGHYGAGRLLVQWGIQESNASGMPLYLESTKEAAPFYEKNGFTTGETISLPIRVNGGTDTQIYEEIVFTYCPT